MKTLFQRLRTFVNGVPAYWIAAFVVITSMVVLVVGLLLYQQKTTRTELRAKDTQIDTAQQALKTANNKLTLIGNAYAVNRDQMFALGIEPQAGSLTQVENPGSPTPQVVTPKSLTVKIPNPDGKGGYIYYTCVDKTDTGNLVCAPPVLLPPKAIPTTTVPGEKS